MSCSRAWNQKIDLLMGQNAFELITCKYGCAVGWLCSVDGDGDGWVGKRAFPRRD